MKLSMKLWIVAILMVVSGSLWAAPPLASIQRAKAIEEEARWQLPMESGFGLTMTSVEFDSQSNTLEYTYYYSFPVDVPSPESIQERRQATIHLLKANPQSEDYQLCKSGISYRYIYFSEDGDYLFESSISPDDLR